MTFQNTPLPAPPSPVGPRLAALPSVMSCHSSSLHLLFAIFGICGGQPILPSLSYPVLIFTPPHVKNQGEQHYQQIEHPVPVIYDHNVPPPPNPGYEVAQFHSQDAQGRVVFGFHSPDQSRMEARSLDGSVRGSYSYIDPNGHVVKMQYWDDGTGFHVAGNGVPAYTPEVAAARAQHLKFYQAALQAAGHVVPPPVSDGSYLQGNDGSYHHGSDHFLFNENTSQFDKEYNPNSLYADDSDSVSLDNPELLGNFDYQEEEKKEDGQQNTGHVEGEVDLGEEVGPDEDEEEDLQHDEEDEDSPYFKKNKNAKKEYGAKIKSPEGIKYIGNERNREDSENKFINRVKYQDSHDNNEDRDKNEQVDHENNEDHNNEEDEESHEEENDENHNDNDHQENDHHEEDHHEDSNDDDNEDNHEEDEDEHAQDGYSQEDSDGENHNFSDRRGTVKDNEESDNDAETAENRKNQLSHVGPGPQKHDKLPTVNSFDANNLRINPLYFPERVNGQLSHRTVVNQIENPQRGFFYQFQHMIPMPEERVDLDSERAALVAQVKGQNPQQQDQPPPLQPAVVQPTLYTGPKPSVRQPVYIASPSEIHDVQVPLHQEFIRD